MAGEHDESRPDRRILESNGKGRRRIELCVRFAILPRQIHQDCSASSTVDGLGAVIPIFCAASETARDVSKQLVYEPVGTLPEHPLKATTMPEALQLPRTGKAKERAAFLHMLQVFVDDFVQLAQTTDEEALRHCSRVVLHGIHSVFPPPNVTGHNRADPVSVKKLLKGKGYGPPERRYWDG